VKSAHDEVVGQFDHPGRWLAPVDAFDAGVDDALDEVSKDFRVRVAELSEHSDDVGRELVVQVADALPCLRGQRRAFQGQGEACSPSPAASSWARTKAASLERGVLARDMAWSTRSRKPGQGGCSGAGECGGGARAARSRWRDGDVSGRHRCPHCEPPCPGKPGSGAREGGAGKLAERTKEIR
jgi:hypothetical protein